MRIVVGGQINKKEIRDFIDKFFDGNVELDIKGDLEAVNDLKSKKYDYYVGACNTGGGGALAMAMALLGKDLCQTISMPGRISSDEDIIQAVNDGKVAFGFTAQDAEKVLPVLLTALKEKEEK